MHLVLSVITAAMFTGGELRRVPLTEIKVNPVALRSVDKESEAYKGIVNSIRVQGVLNAITLRQKTDEVGKSFYEVIDGLQRYSASCDAGVDANGQPITDIPAQILEKSDADVLELQIIGNAQRVETRPEEYSRQLVRILQLHPSMTEAELAVKLGQSPAWINERLNLVKLIPQAADLVNGGQIGLSNAYALSKLPADEQPNWVERAQTTPPVQFVAAAFERKKEIDKARRQGRETTEEKFVAIPHFRKLAEVRLESEVMGNLTSVVSAKFPNDPIKAAQYALSWVLNMDSDTVVVKQAAWEADYKARAENKAQRAAERKAARAKEAAEREARISAEAAKLKAVA